MLQRPTWLEQLKGAIQQSFTTRFGRALAFDDQDLLVFLRDKKITTLAQAIAQFNRAIKYFGDKYEFVPRFTHLTSERIPLVEVDEWEQKLHKDHPAFQPRFFIPSTSPLSARAALGGLYTAADAAYFFEFAKAVEYHPSPTYVAQAVFIVERLVYTLAKSNPLNLSISDVVAVHQTLLRLRRSIRDRHPIWKTQHFSKCLVRQQLISIVGAGFSFWELPKLVVDRRLMEIELNVRVTQQHVDMVMRRLRAYAHTYNPYLHFLIRVRAQYIMRTREELEMWNSVKPDNIPSYPYA